MTTIESWFYKPDEKIVSILGQDYVASVLQGKTQKSVLVLTNERLYQEGVVFHRTQKGRLQKSKGSKVVEVKNITLTSITETDSVAVMAMSVALVILGTIGHISASLSGNEKFGILSVIGVIVGLLFMLVSLVTRRKLFIIDYPLGSILTYAGWYKETELSQFQEAISLAIEEASSET
jgi:hypothetical protein